MIFFIDIITLVISSTQIACDFMCVQHMIQYLFHVFFGIRTIAPHGKLPSGSGSGFGSRLELVLGLGATTQFFSRKITPRLGFGFGLGLVLGLEAISTELANC